MLKRHKKVKDYRKKFCKACGGTGVSSKGRSCIPCNGSGRNASQR